MPFAPIWKDRNITLATGTDYADFEVRIGSAAGELVYSGRAYRRPGSADVVTRINDICAGYLAASLPDLGSRFTSMQVSETFVTVVAGAAVDTVTFVNDWSYDPLRVITATTSLSDPILPELDPRQTFFFSVLDGSDTFSITLHFQDGTSADVVVPVVRTADFNNDFNEDFSTSASAGSSGTAVLDLSTFNGLDYITANGMTFYVREKGCARYVAAYVNAFGGWDTLVLDGICLRRDDLTRHTIDTDYDNADASARGRKDYAIEVAPAWTLRTGILTDAQSEKMHHLLNSTEVYLLDFADMIWRPVVLTDSGNQVQTYKGNGRRPCVYEFNAQLAQERFRR